MCSAHSARACLFSSLLFLLPSRPDSRGTADGAVTPLRTVYLRQDSRAASTAAAFRWSSRRFTHPIARRRRTSSSSPGMSCPAASMAMRSTLTGHGPGSARHPSRAWKRTTYAHHDTTPLTAAPPRSPAASAGHGRRHVGPEPGTRCITQYGTVYSASSIASQRRRLPRRITYSRASTASLGPRAQRGSYTCPLTVPRSLPALRRCGAGSAYGAWPARQGDRGGSGEQFEYPLLRRGRIRATPLACGGCMPARRAGLRVLSLLSSFMERVLSDEFHAATTGPSVVAAPVLASGEPPR